VDLLLDIGDILPFDERHDVAGRSNLLIPVEGFAEGDVPVLVIEIVQISVLEDDEAAYGFRIRYFGFCCTTIFPGAQALLQAALRFFSSKCGAIT
jgi:hypothetical protein